MIAWIDGPGGMGRALDEIAVTGDYALLSVALSRLPCDGLRIDYVSDSVSRMEHGQGQITIAPVESDAGTRARARIDFTATFRPAADGHGRAEASMHAEETFAADLEGVPLCTLVR